ncbi:hypothetical protein [Nocardia puris]|uniref:hypothetical protein n=1 Tax=Nocardia puris TaxID=208602 RepID=UPI002E24F670
MSSSHWAALAEQARRLAVLAEESAARDPRALAPTGDADPFGEMMRLAAEDLAAQVRACRNATWRKLRAEGATLAEIAALWGVSIAAVSKALQKG